MALLKLSKMARGSLRGEHKAPVNQTHDELRVAAFTKLDIMDLKRFFGSITISFLVEFTLPSQHTKILAKLGQITLTKSQTVFVTHKQTIKANVHEKVSIRQSERHEHLCHTLV